MTKQVFVSLKKIISRYCLLIGAAMVSAVVQTSYAAGPLSNGAATDIEHLESAMLVGNVSLVLGKAYLQSPDQSRQRITRGTQVKVSDRISTEANGHVYIHFVDDAMVAVRPDSRLDIVSYDYNPNQPERSQIKFNLVKGVTRAISGKAAKAARDRFRLNTPIAAIGVRGTDFTVRATDTTVRALVYEGTIVMAPFSADCTSASFGPCAVNAVELASESMQIIELDGSTPLPQLLPAPLVRDPDMMREEVQLAIASSEVRADDKNASKDVYLEGVTSTKVTDEAQAEALKVANAPEPQPPGIPDFTPDAVVVAQELTARQLVWGRFSTGQSQNAAERITLGYAEASANREVTVGNSDYGLFRLENGSKQVDKGLGVVSFSLSSAQAFYDSSSGVVAMQVEGGSLGIDFQENLFSTELNLNHSATGPIDFLASGRLYDGGYFHSRSDTQRIAGAVSLDGKEAGYFFEQQLEAGNIQGLTLWDSQ